MLTITAGLAVEAYTSFATVQRGFGTYAQQVGEVGVARDIDRGVLDLRRNVREFLVSGLDEREAMVRRSIAQLRNDFSRAEGVIRQGEGLAKLASGRQRFEAYVAAYDRLVGWKREQGRLVTEVIDPAGARMRELLEGLYRIAAEEEIPSAADAARTGLQNLMQVRLNAAKMLARHDEESAKAVAKFYAQLEADLVRLKGAAAGTPVASTEEAIRALAEKFRDALRRSTELAAQLERMIGTDMRKAGDDIAEDAAFIRDSGVQAQQVVERDTDALIASTMTLVLVLSLAGVAFGVAAALLIGRGISGPIVRITEAMRRLADGDRTVEIPGVGRRDEVGQMAGTLQVFKESLAANDRLRAEQEGAKQRAEEERRTAMLALADDFESHVEGVVDHVSSASGEMKATASSMAAVAEQATRQSTAAAAAAEEASVNVQTVASAAEELAASIAEIGRRVTDSSTTIHHAVEKAERTNEIVGGLRTAAQRIGDVVQLIQEIASQTNLLALNATIEAARAGEMGKGFAVVASEVKQLATQTARATDEIGQQINAVQGATDQAVGAIEDILTTIGDVSRTSTQIAAAVEEQQAATAEIARNVEQAAQGTREVASNIQGVSQAAVEAGRAAEQVLREAGELAKQSLTLRQEVDGFIAKVRAA
ncbi:MAG TPA: methyl-accepting chemotaxis protein [Azospirillum sp.]|nr:methyl-accepting chemotaxis protein [Azospirillum sp.]